MLQSRQSRTKQEPSEGAMKMRQLTHLGRASEQAAACSGDTHLSTVTQAVVSHT
jgi:hypothetical protein